MGWLKERASKDGKTRYTAMYRDVRGQERSAGTFPGKKAANQAWQKAEVKLAEGRIGDPRRSRQRFSVYVDTWLANHVMEPTTKEAYTYQINKHLRPWFGPMRMVEILPEQVREWITDMRAQTNPRTGKAAYSAKTIQNVFNMLSAIFTTALNDQVIFLHPCRGVKTPTAALKPLTVITPEQFDTIYASLGSADAQLLAETAIESGVRWGELTELRVKDLAVTTRIITISRAVVQVDPKFHPDGGRFIIQDYPKDKEFRRFKLSPQIVNKLSSHITIHGLASNDLLFAFRRQASPARPIRSVPDPAQLGLTEPNALGRQYRHGTTSAYGAGKCRCEHCRAAVAIYRASRRVAGKDCPRKPRTRDTDGHIPRDSFRNRIWKPALSKASLDFYVRFHELRHAHASWVLAGGADLQVVKERLGHASIATTEKYLHTLPDADETAVDAFTLIRNRASTA